MTEFTDDLDNDLEVLAEHHDASPVQVAKAAFTQVPENVRLPLLRALLDASMSKFRTSAEAVEPVSPNTGLPQKLRGAIHELTRHYPHNLIVDAAMLELPKDVRENIARTFLPVEPESKREARRYELVDTETAEVLWSGTEAFQPQRFDYVGSDGSAKGYQREGYMSFEFGPGAEGLTGRSYYRSQEGIAELEAARKAEVEKKLAKLESARKAKPKAKPEPVYTLLDETGHELAKSDTAHPDIRLVDNTGLVASYTLVRTVPEYNVNDETVRMVALYRKAQAQ